MSEKRTKLIFELSAKEREDKFKVVINEALRIAAALNLPVVFRNELCIQPNYFIYKYPDGRTILIELDLNNSEEKIVSILS